MGLFRRSRLPERHTLSSPDPVAVAVSELAWALLNRQYDDITPVLAELPDYIHAEDDNGSDGYDTVVSLDDEIHTYADPFDSGLASVLADQPGIEDVLHEDREVFLVRSRLSLEDVRAAMVHAVVEANLRPRSPASDPNEITDQRVDELAEVAAPLLVSAGFTRRTGPSPKGRYFVRIGDDGFAQSAAILPGLGQTADGTQMNRLVHVIIGVRVPEAVHPGSPQLRLETLAPGNCTLWLQRWLDPVAVSVLAHLEGAALPWLTATHDRASFAAWVTADPEGITPPVARALHARLFAEWGQLDAAAALVRHIDGHWPSLRSDGNYLAARAILNRS